MKNRFKKLHAGLYVDELTRLYIWQDNMTVNLWLTGASERAKELFSGSFNECRTFLKNRAK